MRVKDMREKNSMRAVRSLVVVVLAFVVFAAPSVVLADGRVALVVGNSTYAHIGRLPNPDNDARDMSAALRRLGFEVTTELDADRVELTEALRAFTRRSAGADVSLVFYAGHGIEMDGVNYLVPVDARLERDVDVRFETVTVDDLLVSTTGASLRLVLLDACRNNPLARSMQRTAATRTVSGGSFADLNEDLLGDETLVAYAAAAGTTAADGRGRNSPYTSALLSHLETPLEIGLLFRRVRSAVLASTNGAQRPHEYHSLVGEHYLTRTLATGASVTVSAAAPAGPALADPPRPDPPATDVTEFQIAALRELAETGDVEAQTELGERYEDGRDVAQDYTVAVSWFRRAAEQGYAPGQAALGFMYSRGRGVVQDEAEAVQWSRRAADQGDARGQNNLGASYANGFGVAQDDRAAVEWYRRAAEQGWPLAQRNLGEMYETGRGVTRDERQAASWSSGVSTWPFALSRAFFAALGVVVAVALAAQRFVEWRRAYVACSLEISDIHGCAVAKLALEGKSVFRRNVRGCGSSSSTPNRCLWASGKPLGAASGERRSEEVSDPSKAWWREVARRGTDRAERQYYPISTSLGVRTRRCSALRGSAPTHQDRDWLVAGASEPPRLQPDASVPWATPSDHGLRRCHRRRSDTCGACPGVGQLDDDVHYHAVTSTSYTAAVARWSGVWAPPMRASGAQAALSHRSSSPGGLQARVPASAQ